MKHILREFSDNPWGFIVMMLLIGFYLYLPLVVLFLLISAIIDK